MKMRDFQALKAARQEVRKEAKRKHKKHSGDWTKSIERSKQPRKRRNGSKGA